MQSNKIKFIDGFDEVAKMLFYLYALTGLNKNNYPSKEESLLLANFIKDEYQNLTLQEVKLAFSLSVKMELKQFIDKNESLDHFQSFSPMYFGKVIAAYKKYKAHTIKPLLIQKSNTPDYPEISDFDFIKSNFLGQFDKFKKGHYPWSYGADIMIFDILAKNKIIAIDDNEKKLKFNEFKNELKIKPFKTQEEFNNELFKKLKLYFFYKYLNEVVEFGIDLEEVINKNTINDSGSN
jgi:hypothetical protein